MAARAQSGFDLDPNSIKDDDIPQFARRCYQRYMEATQEQREREKESLGFYIGRQHQWRPGEIQAREGKNRPWLTINRCKPAVDQVENEARQNPPGPKASPVGGADADGADVMEGLIREYEYRSHAQGSYINALRYGAGGGSGAFELATEFAGERTFEQQLVVKPIEDPAMVFYDPDAVLPCREDAMWQGKIRVLNAQKMREEFPDARLKILNGTFLDKARAAAGAVQNFMGWAGEFGSINKWTSSGNGPFWVCEFWRVTLSHEKLRLYTDGNLRFDGEKIPPGVKEKEDAAVRTVPRRKVWKHIITALDHIKKTEWLAPRIPIYWVMGPEIWRDGKLYRLSLISNAQDANRGLNYAATSATEICGSMTKSPWVGWEGQFDTTNAQGFNPWESQGTLWAYLEVKPVFATDPVSGASQLLPAPQRNTWEAPIQRLMELANFFAEQVKAATSVFFEPSLPSAAQSQSGAAIKALQQQTNIGTINWQDNLHRAVALSYQDAAAILPEIYDGERVKTIVRPDNQHEIVTINREFPPHEIDQATGKHKGGQPRNSITLGQYSLRVEAGPNFETRTDESIEDLTEIVKFIPALFQNPAAAAQFIRLVGKGNPQVEQLADSIQPQPGQDSNPAQLQQQIQQAAAQNQQLIGVVLKLQMAIQAKLPEVEARKFAALVKAATDIRVEQIRHGEGDKDRSQENIQHAMDQAHELAMQAHAQAGAQQLATTQAALQPPPEPGAQQ